MAGYVACLLFVLVVACGVSVTGWIICHQSREAWRKSNEATLERVLDLLRQLDAANVEVVRWQAKYEQLIERCAAFGADVKAIDEDDEDDEDDSDND